MAFIVMTGSTPAQAACQQSPCSNGGDLVRVVGYALGIPVEVEAAGNQLGGQLTNNDPWVGLATVHDTGATMSSATGAFGAVNGLSQSSHTTDFDTGANANYNASKTFNLGADQRLVLTGLFQFDSIRTTYNANPALPATLDAGSSHMDTYTFAGLASYYVGDLYFDGYLGGRWGNGGLTNNATGGIGSFNTTGYATGFDIGKTYTLFGQSGAAPPSAMPTKAPPRQTIPGNALYLVLSGGIDYADDRVGGFTDSTGFVRGTEQAHNWDFTARAMLVATLPGSGLTWHPYLGINLDQQFGFSHTLDIPAQPANGADIISYGSAQTFVGTRGGLNAALPNGLVLGVEGYYEQSAEFQIAGGQAYVRYYFPN